MCESPSEPRTDKLNAGCHPLGSSTFECFFNRWFLRSSMLVRLAEDLNHESGFDPRQPHHYLKPSPRAASRPVWLWLSSTSLIQLLHGVACEH